MAFLGGIFFANVGGGGVVKIVFRFAMPDIPQSKITATVSYESGRSLDEKLRKIPDEIRCQMKEVVFVPYFVAGPLMSVNLR